MSIIRAVREYMASCPYLCDFTNGEYVDFTVEEAGNYGIMPAGETELSRDFAGNVRNLYGFVLYARQFTVEDANRVENAGFVENISRWMQENDLRGSYPDLGEGMTAEEVSCANGTLFEFDDSQVTGLYQLQCQLIYERMRTV